MNALIAPRLSRLLTIAVLFGFLPPGALAAPPDDTVDTIDTVPGVRVRVYWIGAPMEGLKPVRPGESPNVDETSASLDFANDDSPFGAAADEQFDRQYVLELTGELHVPVAGEYVWRTGSTAAVRVVIDGRTVIEPTGAPTWTKNSVSLEAGWRSLVVRQWVNEPNERFMDHEWRAPGSETFEAIEPTSLRGPEFYFRPTSPGRKQLVADGDRPGLGLKLAGVHPGYRLANIRPDGMEMPVGGLGMLSDGRLIVARFDARTLAASHPTGDPNGQLWLLAGVEHDDPDRITAELIADELYEPSGVCVLDDVIYVSQRSEVSRFELDPTVQIWKKSVVASGWRTNDFHQICAGLLHEPGPTDDHPGFLYTARSPGLGLKQNPPDHGSVWRIDLSQPAGANVTPLTGGHRTPNGLGYGPDQQMFVIDNQGEWTPANELNHVQPGRFYGFYQPHDPPRAYAAPFQPADRETGEVTPPAVLLPQDEIGNSPTQPLMFPAGHAFEGQLALADMRYGGLNRIALEQVEDVWQGCVMRFTQGLEAGPNRILFGPNGALYVGGVGGRHASTWYWVNPDGEPTFQGLEKLTPTDVDVFEIDSMRATPDGFVLTFTKPVPADFLLAPDNFEVCHWTYRATRGYGGPKIDLEELDVAACAPSDDRRRVTLEIPGLKEGFVVHLRTDPRSDDGEPIWSGEVWYTLNRKPAAAPTP